MTGTPIAVTRAIRLVAAVALAAASAGPAAGQALPDAAPVIPNFWGPATRSEQAASGVLEGIRFVTTDDYPPFNFSDASGRLTGFNVDLARAICGELAVPCTIQSRPWDDLIPALTEDRADAAIAGIAISETTRARVAFSDVYLRLAARFAIRDEEQPGSLPAMLAGGRVAVVEGSAHEAYFTAYFQEAAVRSYPTIEAAESALRSGEADLVFGDGLQLSFWLEGTSAGGCCAFIGGGYLDSHFFGEGLAVALRPDDEDLRNAINRALAALYTEGVYAELYLRYFPLGLL